MTILETVTHVTSTFLDSYISDCKQIFMASHLKYDIIHFNWLSPKFKNEISGYSSMQATNTINAVKLKQH
jgi:hypothetical protein